MTKSLEAHIAELQDVIDGPGGKCWVYGPAVSALIAALEQSQQREKDLCVGVDVHRARIAYLEKTLRGTEETLIAAGDQIAELEALCVKSTDAMREVAPLCVKLPAGTRVNGFQMLVESEVVAYLRAAGIDAEVFRTAGGNVEGG